MQLIDIRKLFEYTSWAKARLLSSVDKLSPDEYMLDRRSSHGGIHGTLVHTMGAEEIWLKRWLGESPTTFARPEMFAGLTELRDHWHGVETGILAFCASLKSDDELRGIVVYKDLKGNEYRQALGHLMQHLANHSTFHRGQATGMVRQAGVAPMSQDMVAFFRERYPG